MTQQPNPNYNPYAEPEFAPTTVTQSEMESEAAMIRRSHLSHEASVQSVGLLFVISSFILLAIAVVQIAELLSRSQQYSFVSSIAIIFVCLGLGVLHAYTAWCLNKLKLPGRYIGSVFSAIALINFPCGTIVGAYVLYLLLSRKGTIVFSEGYRSVIEATPHIKYKTSIIVWVFLAVALFFVLIGIAGFLTQRMGR